MKSLKVILTNSCGSRTHSPAQIADWRGFTFCKLLISRISMGNRSYPFFLLRAFKHSAEAERSGMSFTKCNLWRMASRLHWGPSTFHIVRITQHQPFSTANSVISEDNTDRTDRGQNNDTLMVVPGFLVQ